MSNCEPIEHSTQLPKPQTNQPRAMRLEAVSLSNVYLFSSEPTDTEREQGQNHTCSFSPSSRDTCILVGTSGSGKSKVFGAVDLILTEYARGKVLLISEVQDRFDKYFYYFFFAIYQQRNREGVYIIVSNR